MGTPHAPNGSSRPDPTHASEYAFGYSDLRAVRHPARWQGARDRGHRRPRPRDHRARRLLEVSLSDGFKAKPKLSRASGKGLSYWYVSVEMTMRNLSVALSMVAFLSGCATASKTYAPDGSEGYSITCSGSALNWGMCYEKAGDICGTRGYVVLSRSGDQGTVVSGNQFGLYGGSVTNRNILIKCKE